MLSPFLRRLFAFLIIPCLVVDPRTALALGMPAPRLVEGVPQSALFSSQAVNGALVVAPHISFFSQIKESIILHTPILRKLHGHARPDVRLPKQQQGPRSERWRGLRRLVPDLRWKPIATAAGIIVGTFLLARLFVGPHALLDGAVVLSMLTVGIVVTPDGAIAEQYARIQNRLQDIVYENVDHTLRINRHWAILHVDIQATFMGAHLYRAARWIFFKVTRKMDPGGLAVNEGEQILGNASRLNKLFRKWQRFFSQDLHPYGHVSLASSYVGRNPFTILTYPMVRNWSTREEDKHLYLQPHARFSVKELQDYLLTITKQKLGADWEAKAAKDPSQLPFQMLWTNHAVFYLEKTDLPAGDMTFASSFNGFKEFAVLTYEKVQHWTEADCQRYFSDKATFSLSELKAYLKRQPYHAMVLMPDGYESKITEEAKLHPEMLKQAFEYVEIKGTDPTVDSYSAFFDNLRRATELAEVLKAKGIETIVMDGLAFDYCVGWSATGAANPLNGFKVIVVEDATRPVGNPPNGVQMTLLGFQANGVRLVRNTEALVRANEGVVSLLYKLLKRYASRLFSRLNLIRKEAAAHLRPRKPPVDKETVDIRIPSIEKAYKAFKEGRRERTWVDFRIPSGLHGGSYIISAGLEDALAGLHTRKFSKPYIKALRKLHVGDEEFLKYLSEFEFTGDISAPREGRSVSPGFPSIRILASPVEVELIKDLLRNRVGGASIVATKASRVAAAARGEFVDDEIAERDPSIRNPLRETMEFGLRRAAGLFAMAASRAAFIGGAYRSSFVKAGKQFDLWIAGTMAHLFIMFYGPKHEIDAFRAYARVFPKSSVFLIDTYDPIQGAAHALQVAIEMRNGTLVKEKQEEGSMAFVSCEAIGVRLDIDEVLMLTEMSKKIRKMFDDAGFPNLKIVASGGMDEFKITDALSKGAKIDSFGVGTDLVTGGKQAFTEWEIVPADESTIWRVHDAEGYWHDVSVPRGNAPELAPGETAEELLVPYWTAGERTLEVEEDPRPAAARAAEDLKGLTKAQKRLVDPEPLKLVHETGIPLAEAPADRLSLAPTPTYRVHPLPIHDESEALVGDLYHYTMGAAIIAEGRHLSPVRFDYFYRKVPDSRLPFTQTANFSMLLDKLPQLRFRKEDIAYLRSKGIPEATLDYLQNYTFQGDIYAQWGTAYPQEPILTVVGTMLDALLLESWILVNCNYPQLIATQASIERLNADGKPLIEDGLAQAQGLAHLDGSNAAYIGGVDYTTNLDAVVKFGIPGATTEILESGKRLSGEFITGGPKKSHSGVYKLGEVDGQPASKVAVASPEKSSAPAAKQVYDVLNIDGQPVDRVISLLHETVPLEIQQKAVARQTLVVHHGVAIGGPANSHEERAKALRELDAWAESPNRPMTSRFTPGLAGTKEALIDQALHEVKPDSEHGVKVAMAQIDVKIMNFNDTVQRIEQRIQQAVEAGTDVLIFPETIMTGYPAQDHWVNPENQRLQAEALKRIEKMTEGTGLTVVMGSTEPAGDGKVYNVAYVIQNGDIVRRVVKYHMAQGAVYDDSRRFKRGDRPDFTQNWIDIKGRRFGIAICEDIWQEGENVVQMLADQGVTDVIAINGSHYIGSTLQLLSKDDPSFDPERDYEYLGFRYRFNRDSKLLTRDELLKRRATESKVNIYYVNAAGANDGIVFDAHSMAVDSEGRLRAWGPDFKEDVIQVEVGKDGKITSLDDQRTRGKLALDPVQQDYEAAVLCLADYMRKNNQTKLVIGLSGGIDSAVSLAIAVDALELLHLPATNIIGVSMPSDVSSDHSKSDARAQAESFGITYITIPISEMVRASRRAQLGGWMALLKFWLRRTWARLMGRPVNDNDLYGGNYENMMENIQAGARGQILYRLANRHGALVLNNGNRIETIRGYYTADGDGGGSIGILGGWPKTLVAAAGQARNRLVKAGLKKGWIPEGPLNKEPSAELQKGQTDQEALGKLPILDKIDDILLESNWDLSEVVRRRDECDPDHILSNEEFSNYLYMTFKRFYDNVWKGKKLPIALIRSPNQPFGSIDIPTTAQNPWLNRLPEIQQIVKDARELGYTGSAPRKVIVRTENRGALRFTVKKYPDGELNVVNLDSWMTQDAEAVIRHRIDSADDIVEILLMIENLRHYQAASVTLEIDGPWHPQTRADELLVRLLRSQVDELRLEQKAGDFIPVNLDPLPAFKKHDAPMAAAQIVTLDARLAPMATEASNMLGGMHTAGMKIETLPNMHNHWSVAETYQLVNGMSAVIAQATDTSENIVKLLIALLSMRDTGGWDQDLAVYHTYFGYGRQDKVWIPGQTPAALALLKVYNKLARQLAVSPHFSDEIVDGLFEKEPIVKLNGFIPLSRRMFDRVAKEAMQGAAWEDLLDAQQELRRQEIITVLGGLDETDVARFPVLLIAPDDGAHPGAYDAEQALVEYVWKKYRIHIRVMSAHLDKTRIDEKTAQTKPQLWTIDGKPFELPEGVKLADCYAFVPDDETSSGMTLRNADYVLVRAHQMPWSHIYTAVVQMKSTKGMEPFNAGLPVDQRATAREPDPFRVKDGQMPPYLFFATESLPKHPDMPADQVVSLGGLLADAVENLAEDRVPLWRQVASTLMPSLAAEIAEEDRPDRDLYRQINPSQLDWNARTVDVPWAESSFIEVQKYGRVRAVPAVPGSVIETRIGENLVTVNIAKEGDLKLTTEGIGDHYLLPASKFQNFYNADPDADGWYRPKPITVKALRLTQPVRLMAPWGKMQYVPSGSVLLHQSDDDIYAVHRRNFIAGYHILGPGSSPSMHAEPIAIGLMIFASIAMILTFAPWLSNYIPTLPHVASTPQTVAAWAVKLGAMAEIPANWTWIKYQFSNFRPLSHRQVMRSDGVVSKSA